MTKILRSLQYLIPPPLPPHMAGKDTSVFVTKEDAGKPEVVSTLAQEEGYGIVLPSGEINWDCPCLGGMAQGPCGQEFKDAFSCFHYSEEEDKGSDCIPQFKGMQECFQKYPEVYSKYAEEDDSEDTKEENERSEVKVTPETDSSEPIDRQTDSSKQT